MPCNNGYRKKAGAPNYDWAKWRDALGCNGPSPPWFCGLPDTSIIPISLVNVGALCSAAPPIVTHISITDIISPVAIAFKINAFALQHMHYEHCECAPDPPPNNTIAPGGCYIVVGTNQRSFNIPYVPNKTPQHFNAAHCTQYTGIQASYGHPGYPFAEPYHAYCVNQGETVFGWEFSPGCTPSSTTPDPPPPIPPPPPELPPIPTLPPSGPPGPRGATGATGAAGAVGAAGPAGVVGAVGPKGDKGDKGDVGATGPAGADGVDGVAGPAGADGADGAVGPAGPAGPAGSNSGSGAVGPAGPAGATGSVGPKGDKGDKGEKGDPGTGGNVEFTTVTVDVGSCINNLFTSNQVQVSSIVGLESQTVMNFQRLFDIAKQTCREPDLSVGEPLVSYTKSVYPCVVLYFNDARTSKLGIGRYLQIPNPNLLAILSWVNGNRLYKSGDWMAYNQYFDSKNVKVSAFGLDADEADMWRGILHSLTNFSNSDIFHHGNPRQTTEKLKYSLYLVRATYFLDNSRKKSGKQTGELIWENR